MSFRSDSIDYQRFIISSACAIYIYICCLSLYYTPPLCCHIYFSTQPLEYMFDNQYL